MKKKTYNNVMKAKEMIMKKGYDEKEATKLALNIFEYHENDVMPIEFYIDKVATKEEWLKDQERYGYLYQGGKLSYPVGY